MTSPLFLLLFVLTAAIGFAVAMTRRKSLANRATGDHAGPVCGRCGYSVVGLQSLQCPECGSDLRHVGILVPGRSAAPRRAGVIVGILLMAFCSWALFASVAHQLLPRRTSFESRAAFDGPDSAAYVGADVVTDALRWSGRPPRAQARIELRTTRGAAPPAAMLDVDPITSAYSYVARNGRAVSAPAGLNGDVVLAWMTDAGVGISSPQASVEAATLATEARKGMMIRHLGDDDGPDFGSQGSSSGASPGFVSSTRTERTKSGVTDVTERVTVAATIIGWLAATAYLIRRVLGAGPSTAALNVEVR